MCHTAQTPKEGGPGRGVQLPRAWVGGLLCASATAPPSSGGLPDPTQTRLNHCPGCLALSHPPTHPRLVGRSDPLSACLVPLPIPSHTTNTPFLCFPPSSNNPSTSSPPSTTLITTRLVHTPPAPPATPSVLPVSTAPRRQSRDRRGEARSTGRYHHHPTPPFTHTPRRRVQLHLLIPTPFLCPHRLLHDVRINPISVLHPLLHTGSRAPAEQSADDTNPYR